MNQFNTPVFVLTGDIDWASEPCIEDFLGVLDRFGVKPVLMATHVSPVVSQRAAEERIELGLHPNFLPGSTQGDTLDAVIRHLFGIFPEATTFRSHCFVDSSQIAAAMLERGLRYDSNLCLYLQSNLVPLCHQSGLMRFPVFWEDDVHWAHGGSWRVDDMIDQFLQPGLKVLNFHPFSVALNIPDGAFYRANKKHTTSASTTDLERLRHRGDGARTFLIDLLQRLQKLGHRFYTLGEIYRMIAGRSRTADGVAYNGVVLPSDYDRYWQVSEDERQSFLKRHYNQRDPSDPYATSRDFNLRELEIQAICNTLPESGHIVDLGCGNGYTTISLARVKKTHTFVGIDFAEKLIEGARTLCVAERPPLAHSPNFVCDDAIAYVSRLADNSVDAVITERFLLNLPSPEMQRFVIRDCFRALRRGGRLLMCEASGDGFAALNDLRVACGLSTIAETSTDNVSAIRFQDAEIERFISEIGFRLAGKLGFSTYFIISRVLHPLLVQPLPPRFGAPINMLARVIQSRLPLNPSFGSNVLWVLEKT